MGAVLLNPQTGNPEYVPDEGIPAAVQAGFTAPAGGVPVSPAGVSGSVSVDPRRLSSALARGGTPVNLSELAQRRDVERQRAKFDTLGQEVIAFGEGAFSGATLGLTDLLTDSYESRMRADVNPWASGVGTVAGVLVPSLLSGGAAAPEAIGAGAARAGARLLPTALAARAARSVGVAVEEALAAKAAGTLTKAVVRGTTLAVEGGIEGAIWGSAQATTDALLGRRPFTGEAILSQALLGAGIGGLLGTAGGVLDGLSKGSAKAIQGATAAERAEALGTVAGRLRESRAFLQSASEDIAQVERLGIRGKRVSALRPEEIELVESRAVGKLLSRAEKAEDAFLESAGIKNLDAAEERLGKLAVRLGEDEVVVVSKKLDDYQRALKELDEGLDVLRPSALDEARAAYGAANPTPAGLSEKLYPVPDVQPVRYAENVPGEFQPLPEVLGLGGRQGNMLGVKPGMDLRPVPGGQLPAGVVRPMKPGHTLDMIGDPVVDPNTGELVDLMEAQAWWNQPGTPPSVRKRYQEHKAGKPLDAPFTPEEMAAQDAAREARYGRREALEKHLAPEQGTNAGKASAKAKKAKAPEPVSETPGKFPMKPEERVNFPAREIPQEVRAKTPRLVHDHIGPAQVPGQGPKGIARLDLGSVASTLGLKTTDVGPAASLFMKSWATSRAAKLAAHAEHGTGLVGNILKGEAGYHAGRIIAGGFFSHKLGHLAGHAVRALAMGTGRMAAAAGKVTRSIEAGVASLLRPGNVRVAYRAALATRLGDLDLGLGRPEDPKITDSPESYHALLGQYRRAAASPALLKEALGDKFLGVQALAPDIAEVAIDRAAGIVRSVLARAPKPPPSLVRPDKWAPDAPAMRSWLRYAGAARNPEVYLADLGNAPQEAIEALQENWPELFAEAQSQLLRRAAEFPNLSHTAAARVSRIVGVPLTQGSDPLYAQRQQELYAAEAQPTQPPGSGGTGASVTIKLPGATMTPGQNYATPNLGG